MLEGKDSEVVGIIKDFHLLFREQGEQIATVSSELKTGAERMERLESSMGMRLARIESALDGITRNLQDARLGAVRTETEMEARVTSLEDQLKTYRKVLGGACAVIAALVVELGVEWIRVLIR